MDVAADPAHDAELARTAAALAEDLGLVYHPGVRSGAAMRLVVTPGRLELRVQRGEGDLCGGRPVFSDPARLDTRTGAGRSLRQPLARAVGLGRGKGPAAPFVLDATAGLGQDAWLLASLGCRVLAVERSPLVAALLRDGLRRAGARDPRAFGRITVLQGDSRHVLGQIAAAAAGPRPGQLEPPCPAPDVVYLDPMFPPKRKARERKSMRVLRALVGPDPDAAELLALGMLAARRRTVVKRTRRAAPLGEGVTVTHRGTSLRYDVYT